MKMFGSSTFGYSDISTSQTLGEQPAGPTSAPQRDTNNKTHTPASAYCDRIHTPGLLNCLVTDLDKKKKKDMEVEMPLMASDQNT